MNPAISPSNSVLFQPFRVGPKNLVNRIVMAPMTRQHSPNGVPGQNVADYYRRRIEGGVGLIITEGTYIDHPSANAYPNAPDFFGSSALAGWQRVVDAVHHAGGHIIPQLWHTGPARRPGLPHDPSVPGSGPVDIHDKNGQLLVKALTKEEIVTVVKAYAQAAHRAEQLGFDGIEIHAAHEFLLDSFLWAKTNSRSDAYGGTIENRLRFTLEVVQAVRRVVSRDFPIVLRFSQFKRSDYTARIAETPAELGQILQPLAEAGVDVFHASARRFWEPAFPGSSLGLAGWARQLTGKPVIAVGSIGLQKQYDDEEDGFSAPAELQQVIERMSRNEFDLVAVGRALLCDPEWANKVKDGRFNELMSYDKAILQQDLF